jgi:hypothetical protein
MAFKVSSGLTIYKNTMSQIEKAKYFEIIFPGESKCHIPYIINLYNSLYTDARLCSKSSAYIFLCYYYHASTSPVLPSLQLDTPYIASHVGRDESFVFLGPLDRPKTHPDELIRISKQKKVDEKRKRKIS